MNRILKNKRKVFISIICVVSFFGSLFPMEQDPLQNSKAIEVLIKISNQNFFKNLIEIKLNKNIFLFQKSEDLIYKIKFLKTTNNQNSIGQTNTSKEEQELEVISNKISKRLKKTDNYLKCLIDSNDKEHLLKSFKKQITQNQNILKFLHHLQQDGIISEKANPELAD